MNDRLQLGICIPNFRAGTGPETMLAATQTAERLGWHSAFTTDHILVDGAERARDYRHIYEALTSVAWLAGQTTTIRLGTSVLVAPMRNAVVMAKELATIDALSDGRLIAGVGIGWNRTEFESVGEGVGIGWNRTEFESVGEGERFGNRGTWLEETIALWRHLWAGGESPYSGRFDGYAEGFFSPLPPQGADLPIWIGATAERALLRAGRVADGYHSTRTDPETMRQRVRVVSEAAALANRPMPTASTRLSVDFTGTREGPSVVTGTPDEMAARLRAYRDAGTDHVALDFCETDPDMAAKAVERFDREVVPAV
jgi:alkanesulfonate monooxygenase SsuD/methylene tetrahydromethanopterin reductase-like flavin-dependent oxidoreductase (luciferase family)